jgi:hypothetical protein
MQAKFAARFMLPPANAEYSYPWAHLHDSDIQNTSAIIQAPIIEDEGTIANDYMRQVKQKPALFCVI